MQTWIFPLLYNAVSRFTLLCICFLWSRTCKFNPDKCSFTFRVILLAKLLEELSTWFNGAKSKTTILGLFIQSCCTGVTLMCWSTGDIQKQYKTTELVQHIVWQLYNGKDSWKQITGQQIIRSRVYVRAGRRWILFDWVNAISQWFYFCHPLNQYQMLNEQ